MKSCNVKVGDVLWIASYPLMDYVVTAVIKRQENIQYEIKCLKCNHVTDCLLLVGLNDNGNIEYKGMVNENSEEPGKHYFFHKGIYKTTKEDAYIYMLKDYVSKNKDKIVEHEKIIKYLESENQKHEVSIAMFQDALRQAQKEVK